LRPYKAAITGNTGIDTENLWDGSYPFVIQNHHRYTTVFKGMLRYDGEIKDISEVFMRIKNVRQDENGTVITYEPVHITIGTCDITLEVITIIGKDGSIVTERHFTGVSKPGETLEFCDYLRGSLGTNDLPANLAGTGLEAVGSSKRQGI